MPRDALAALEVYADRRMLAIGLLGFSSGLPRLLVYSTLTFWLLEHGLSITAVGLFAATGLPYNFKFAWAPLLDRLRIPLLTRVLGLRRGWLLVLQLGVMASLVALSRTNPGVDPFAVAAAALVVATFSASQDVVIDAVRVELLADDEQGAGAAAVVFGYRIGMLVASAGALYLAAATESWPLTYLAMAGCMLLGVLTTLLMREPASSAATVADDRPLPQQVVDAVVGPFRDFLQRPGTLLILAFIILYKLGDALAGTMTNPLLVALEFEKTTIANVAKTFGLVASIGGVFLGGALVRKLGVVRALWVSGFLQMGSNLLFTAQAMVGKSVALLVATIGIENLSGGLGTAAFVAYLSALCNKRYTATQYAFLTAASSVLQTVISTSSGALAQALGWPLYFTMTTAAALPGLALLWVLQRRATDPGAAT